MADCSPELPVLEQGTVWPAPAGEGVQRAAAIAPPRIGMPMGLGTVTGGG